MLDANSRRRSPPGLGLLSSTKSGLQKASTFGLSGPSALPAGVCPKVLDISKPKLDELATIKQIIDFVDTWRNWPAFTPVAI